MINLVLAIISSSLVSIVMRVSGKYLKSNLGMTVTNYVICTAMAALYSGVGNLFPSGEDFGFTLGTGVFTGVLYLAGLLLIQFNIKKNGVVMSAIFQKLGLVIQVLLSIIVFKEQPEVLQIIGIIICLVSVIVINFEKEQTIIQFKLGLVLILLVSGFCDGMSKVHEEMGNPSLSEHFLLYTFGTALILCLGLIAYKKESIGSTGYCPFLPLPGFWFPVCLGEKRGKPVVRKNCFLPQCRRSALSAFCCATRKTPPIPRCCITHGMFLPLR